MVRADAGISIEQLVTYRHTAFRNYHIRVVPRQKKGKGEEERGRRQLPVRLLRAL